MGHHWQVRWQDDKRALRCEASGPEKMLLLRIHSSGQSLPKEGPNLGKRTGRCVCMSQLHSGEIGAQRSPPPHCAEQSHPFQQQLHQCVALLTLQTAKHFHLP